MRWPECEFRNERTGWQWRPFAWAAQPIPGVSETLVSAMHTLLDGRIYGQHTPAGMWQELRVRHDG